MPPASALAWRRLFMKLFAAQAVSVLAGLVMFTVKNHIVSHQLVPHVEGRGIPYPIAIVLLIIAVLGVHLAWRLYSVRQLLTQQSQVRLAVRKLLLYPYQLLASMLFAGLSSMAVSVALGGSGNLVQAYADALAGGIGMSLTMAVLLFVAVRGVLRGTVLRLQRDHGGGLSLSIIWPFLATYLGAFLAAMLNVLQLMLIQHEQPASLAPQAIIGAASIDVALGLALAIFVTTRFRNEFRGLVRSLRELVMDGHPGAVGSQRKEPEDEAGDLALVFRELQARARQRFEQFERELRLANKVQQKLLPPGDMTIGSYRIAARSRPYHEVGGDFFDVLSLGPNRFAIMIGDVSGKGVPAALLMSALLLLFRAEIRRNGNPAEVMMRINEELCEAIGEEGAVTMGIGVVDSVHDTLQYVSAGHLSPYIVSECGSVKALDCSSLPIGIDPETRYESIVLKLQPGDQLVLYTDGLIESMDETGRMYSFDGLESELAQWRMGDELPERVDDWLGRMDAKYAKDNDDRTIVVLELVHAYWLQAAEREAAAALDGALLDELAPSRFYAHDWMLGSAHGTERMVAEQVGMLVSTFWPETVLGEDVQSAVSEGIMNAMEHGNRLRPGSVVTVQAQVGSRITVIRIYDSGGGFFPHVARNEEEMARKRESEDPRGWGLVLIDALSDYWATGRDERGFYLEIYFMRKTRA
ncbi:SpoIIE family protein phosphatase [Paenibacillus aurantiacus]|uniref:SpoIIE family protein phosphatase n=1 Tax=Paenibacillus aurantiacus TaxID=1936118 RepID=A0ABV5KXB4_9BACL